MNLTASTERLSRVCKVPEQNEDLPKSNLIAGYQINFGMKHANGLTNGLTLSAVVACKVNLLA
jgi:hypothetical protein